MANRKNSDAPTHELLDETFPGPGPGRVDQGTSGVHPVEQMVDAAIDRIAREYEAARDSTPAGAVLPPKVDALARPEDVRRLPRLRWKGLEVSEEFRRYAERVAQGEDLPPFEGRILADPNTKFPWEPAARRSASRRAVGRQVALWGSAALVGGLMAWVVSVRLTPAGTASFPAPPAQTVSEIYSNRGEPASAPLPGSAAVDDLGATPSDTEPLAPSTSEVAEQPEAPPIEVAAANAPEVTLRAAAKAPSPPPVVRYRPERAPAVVERDPAPPVISRAPAPATDGAPATPVNIATPGALRDALGALLAARATNENGPGETRTAPAPSPAAPSGDSSGSAPAVDARKEPASESSGNESLLVEKPSF